MTGMGVASPSRSAEATRSSSPPFVPWRASWWEGRLPRSAKIWAAFGAPWQVTVNCDGLDQKRSHPSGASCDYQFRLGSVGEGGRQASLADAGPHGA